MSVPLRSTKSGDAFDHDMKMQKVCEITYYPHISNAFRKCQRSGIFNNNFSQIAGLCTLLCSLLWLGVVCGGMVSYYCK